MIVSEKRSRIGPEGSGNGVTVVVRVDGLAHHGQHVLPLPDRARTLPRPYRSRLDGIDAICVGGKTCGCGIEAAGTAALNFAHEVCGQLVRSIFMGISKVKIATVFALRCGAAVSFASGPDDGGEEVAVVQDVVAVRGKSAEREALQQLGLCQDMGVEMGR